MCPGETASPKFLMDITSLQEALLQIRSQDVYSRPQVWLGITLLFFAGMKMLWRKPRKYPDVPWLRISDLPGAAGDAADAKAYVNNGFEVLRKGYEKYSKNGQNFMMRTPEGGQFVALPKHVEELRSANDRDLNNLPANNELMQTRHTMHRVLETDQYHFQVVQRQLTHSLGPGLPVIVDECVGAFRDEIGEPTDWKSIHMFPVAFKIVTRTANRLLFGSDLCKDEEFLQLAIDYSNTFFGGANLIRHYPEWMKPLVMYFKTGIYREISVVKKHLIPLVNERIAVMREAQKNGTMKEFEKTKPSDTVQWVLDITPPDKLDPHMLVIRLLHILVAAVHTSSVTYLNCLYDLSLRPEIHDELREEIEAVFKSESGQWRKQGLTKLWKMDSFMKESARFHPFTAGTMDRIAMRDYTLADGTLVPKGTYVLVPSSAACLDKDVWGPDADKFDPWRFQKMRLEPGQETAHSFVQTTAKFTYFGHGKHACPGRFFAANEIKVLLTYTLMKYDVKLPPNVPEPQLRWFSGKTMPDMDANLLWKIRPGVTLPWLELLAEGGH